MFATARSRAFYMLTLIFLIYLFDYADRKVISSLFTSIQLEWGTDKAHLELLNGVVSLMIAIFVIPMSILVDRWSRKKMIAIMVFVWSIATLMCGFASTYNQLLIFRALTGLGEAAYAAAAVALLTKAFPVQHRAKYIGIYDAAAPIGSGIGIIAGGIIGAKYGWRASFGLLAVPGMILSVMILFVNDYHTLKIKKKAQETISLTKSVLNDALYLIKIPTLRYLYIAYGLIITVNTTVIDFLPMYLETHFDVLKQKAGMLSGVLAIGVLFGAILGGVISDIWQKKNVHAKIHVSIISTLLSVFFLFLALNGQTLTVTLVMFGFFGLNTVAFLAPVSTMIQQVVNSRVRALAFGINVLVMNLFVFIFSYLIGLIADNTNLNFALLLLPIFGVIASILFYLVRFKYYNDLSKVTE